MNDRLSRTNGDTQEPLLARMAAIVPELAALQGDPDVDEQAVVTGRFALFDDVATILRQAAAMGPLLLVFDDVHAADPDSLRLLQFVARDLPHGRIGIVATYRPDDAAKSGAGALLDAHASRRTRAPARAACRSRRLLNSSSRSSVSRHAAPS